jgi:hypothetical protein
MSHKVNLFDINAKYGDVMEMDKVLHYLDSVDDDLFRDRWPRQMRR